MRHILASVATVALPAALVSQAPTTLGAVRLAASAPAATIQGRQPLVEFELMTWPEVKAALAAGKTTALVYTGGTEQRGPQNVNGGHTLMGKATVKAIALKLGNAIAMPVLPYTPNNASAALPGTIGLTPELLSALLERITEQTIVTGFKNVILMGDHGGGQPNTYQEVAKKLDEKYAPQGIHIYYCNDVYTTANADFDKFLQENNMPVSSHAGIPDTSEMMYLDSTNTWVRRDLVATAVGTPVVRGGGGRGRGQPGDTAAARGGGVRGAGAPRDPGNGISGDARPSTAALGKKVFDMKVDYAVKQIQGFLKGQ
jgi:creatinine amidohydrolase/Fe(II)-dependent formamide hydrolase-like protein